MNGPTTTGPNPYGGFAAATPTWGQPQGVVGRAGEATARALEMTPKEILESSPWVKWSAYGFNGVILLWALTKTKKRPLSLAAGLLAGLVSNVAAAQAAGHLQTPYRGYPLLHAIVGMGSGALAGWVVGRRK